MYPSEYLYRYMFCLLIYFLEESNKQTGLGFINTQSPIHVT